MSYDTNNTYHPNKSESIGGGVGANAVTNGKGSLLEGSYNEAQSHQEFLDALTAWRTGKPGTNNTIKKNVNEKVSIGILTIVK